MRKTIYGVLFVLLLVFLSIPEVGYSQDQYIRLHVKAESNRVADQQVKLKVRDGILYYLQELQQCDNLTDAKMIIQENLSELEKVAEQVLRQEGFSQQVTAQLKRTTFPDKTYGDLFLPEGEYLALQILIGEAQGDNWWCVLYPPLCYGQWEQPTDDSLEEAVAVYAGQQVDQKEKKSDFWCHFNHVIQKVLGESNFSIVEE